MKITNFIPFIGQHCETTTTGSLLQQLGIQLSEPMLFGLGEGLGFIFWKMKPMGFPFIGGRIRTDLLTERLCRNLNLTLTVKETSSRSKAWKNVKDQIDAGLAVGLKLDCYHLDYFTNKIHFAGHYVAMYGYDDEHAYLIDTDQQGGRVKTTLNNLELARNERGPMSSRNRSYTITKTGPLTDLKTALKVAIKNNATDFLSPPIKNLGYKGILKASSEIPQWFFSTENVKRDFQTMAMLMERAGTGGALFRNLYRDFLMESAELLDSEKLRAAHQDYSEIARQWKEVSDLLNEAGKTRKVEYIDRTSNLLMEIADREKTTMMKLEKTFA